MFERLGKIEQNTLLRIPIKRIIINQEGEIVSCDLHPPFSYLYTLITREQRKDEEGSGSEFVTLGALHIGIKAFTKLLMMRSLVF